MFGSLRSVGGKIEIYAGSALTGAVIPFPLTLIALIALITLITLITLIHE